MVAHLQLDRLLSGRFMMDHSCVSHLAPHLPNLKNLLLPRSGKKRRICYADRVTLTGHRTALTLVTSGVQRHYSCRIRI